MPHTQEFIDHYAALQVDPGCDAAALEGAYRHYAKLFHPDHTETADLDRFNDVIMAYRVLRDPDKRAAYDREHRLRYPGQHQAANAHAAAQVENTALSDADVHEKILFHLYRRRREHAAQAGVGAFRLQELAACSDEHFEFHAWYLRAKNLIEITEDGLYAITIDGIDHVIATSRTSEAQKLLGGVREKG